jgi:hypothetical protein
MEDDVLELLTEATLLTSLSLLVVALNRTVSNTRKTEVTKGRHEALQNNSRVIGIDSIVRELPVAVESFCTTITYFDPKYRVRGSLISEVNKKKLK